jgi:hypothetical protein
MSKQILDSKYICSIYPGDLPPMKFYQGESPNPASPRCVTYEMKGVPKGSEPAVIEVSDAFENVHDILASTRKRRAFSSKIVPCERTTNNILQHWAGNMVGVPTGMGPGIMEIANSAPTTAEIAELERRQTAFFEFMFAEGERLMADKRMKEITQPMVLAAEWLQRKTTWASATFVNTTPCRHCKQDIPQDASVCYVCGRDQRSNDGIAPAAALSSTDRELAELREKINQLMANQSQPVNAQPQAQNHPGFQPPNSGKPAAVPPVLHPKPLPPEKP